MPGSSQTRAAVHTGCVAPIPQRHLLPSSRIRARRSVLAEGHASMTMCLGQRLLPDSRFASRDSHFVISLPFQNWEGRVRRSTDRAKRQANAGTATRRKCYFGPESSCSTSRCHTYSHILVFSIIPIARKGNTTLGLGSNANGYFVDVTLASLPVNTHCTIPF